MSDSKTNIGDLTPLPLDKDTGQTIIDTALLRVVKGSVLILLGLLLARVCGFLRQFLVIRMLSPTSYGLFTLSLTIVNVLVALGCLGLYNGVQRFIAYNVAKDDLPKVKGTIRSSLMIVSAMGVMLMILTMGLSSSMAGFFGKPQLKDLLLIMAPMVPFNIISMIIAAYFLGLHKPGPTIWVQDIGFGLVSVIAILAALLIVRSVSSAAIGIAISFSLVFLGSIYIFVSRWPLDLKSTRAAPITKALLYFSLPLFLADSLYLIMGNVDNVVVGHYLSSAKLGFYNAAFLLMSLIPIFLGAVSIMYLPVATSLKVVGHHDESLSLYQSSTRWLFILTLPLFLTFFLFPAQTLALLFGTRYTAAATSLWILSLGAFINTFLGPNNFALVAYGETRLVLYGSLAPAAVDVVICLLLVPRIGISGAAIATAVALGVSNLMFSSMLWIKHKLHPFERKYLFAVVFLFAFGLALYWPLRSAINSNHWLVVAVYPLFLIAGLLFIVVTRSISEEDKVLWRTLRDRFRS